MSPPILSWSILLLSNSALLFVLVESALLALSAALILLLLAAALILLTTLLAALVLATLLLLAGFLAGLIHFVLIWHLISSGVGRLVGT